MDRAAITFYGGVGTVTGSKHLVDSGSSRVLIDCGLFQGLSSLRRRNWQPPPFDWRSLDAVVLTHAHLDHSGYLPLLARHGWRGPVYVTEGTAKLAEIVLLDSAHLLEEEAEQANSGGWSKHRPALPLYDTEDVRQALKLLRPLPFNNATELPGGCELTFGRAGHILGAAWAKLAVPTPAGVRTVVSSGDLGRPSHPLLRPPDPRPDTDVLLLESTYGARQHQRWDSAERLADIINRAALKGGSVLIPAFAVDRTEMVLYELAQLQHSGSIPDLPIVVDSPMALRCLDVYREACKNGSPELRDGISIDLLDPGHLIESHTAAESARWNDPGTPAVIISASGMASGGRVLHHLRHMLPNRNHTVAIVGYAAEGTRARQLAEGANHIKIHGEYVPVRAEVVTLDYFSAHADADELYDWATAAPQPDTCFLVHGEENASEALARRLREDADWNAVVPREGERVLF
jgi:metallo-beta-lactamase family protein